MSWKLVCPLGLLCRIRFGSSNENLHDFRYGRELRPAETLDEFRSGTNPESYLRRSARAHRKFSGLANITRIASHSMTSIPPTELSLVEAQRSVDDWIQQIGVRYFSELTNLAQLVEEVGELARILSRVYGDQSFKQGEEDHADLADELADILFVTICLANQTGVDLSAALQRNLEKKSSRDVQRHHNNPKLKKPE